jgi:pyruvate dehydrogenase E2 component (dihydrolipoamide acetyltransferase)
MTRIAAITVPKWGIEMQEGTITAWHAAPGQRVARGEQLLDVETDKIVNSVESPATGTLRRIIAGPGETHAVGALIGVFAEQEVSEAEIDAYIASYVPPDTSFEYDAGNPAEAASSRPAPTEPRDADAEQRVSPIARKRAEELGVDVSTLKGTGRNGRVSKEDVEAAYAARPALATDSNKPLQESLSSMRLTIARRLVESKQTIPHYRIVSEVDVVALLERRASLKSQGVGVTDLLLRACALALVRHPQVNAQLDGNTMLKFPHADIALAVATDHGLVTPIVRSVDTKTVDAVAQEASDLIARAREGRLERLEITGGTFTVSNLGMFGVERFDAIINPPQVGIVAVGTTREVPVVRNGEIRIGQRVTLTYAFDHRVVDGAEGARFAATVRAHIENPATL